MTSIPMNRHVEQDHAPGEDCSIHHLATHLSRDGLMATVDVEQRGADRYRAALDAAAAAGDTAAFVAMNEAFNDVKLRFVFPAEVCELVRLLSKYDVAAAHEYALLALGRLYGGDGIGWERYYRAQLRDLGGDPDAVVAERLAWYETNPVQLPEMLAELRDLRARVGAKGVVEGAEEWIELVELRAQRERVLALHTPVTVWLRSEESDEAFATREQAQAAIDGAWIAEDHDEGEAPPEPFAFVYCKECAGIQDDLAGGDAVADYEGYGAAVTWPCATAIALGVTQ